MTRLQRRLRLKLRRQPRADGLPRRRLAARAALTLLVASELAACEPPQPYEEASNGPIVYLDQLSDAAKAAARQKIVQSLSRGVGTYDLGVGDEVEVFFHVRRRPTAKAYVIAPADKLRVDFLSDTQTSQIIEVRPDGRISVPLLGPAMAAGQTPDALARQLERRYSNILTKPEVTVSVTEAHSRLDDFIDVVSSTSTKGRSIVDTVLPDGTVSVPLLPPFKVLGRPLTEVERAIDAAYSAKGFGVFVSLVPRKLHSNATLVIGEVSVPGRVELYQPTTVLMAVAQAGGVTKAGSMSSVRLYYIGDDGVQHVRQIDLDRVMSNLALEDDMIVPANSIIYVPPTELAKAGRFMDAVVRDILRYQGTNLGAAFQIAPQSQGGGVTVFQQPALSK